MRTRFPRGLQDLHASILILLFAVAAPACSGGKGETERLPEEDWIYPMSHVFVGGKESDRSESLVKALAILHDLRAGANFADVARSRSENEMTKALGGFMGFLQANQENPLSPALQALPPGQIGGPVEADSGFHVLYRHTFEEARRLEESLTIPIYGYFVGWGDSQGAGGRTKEQAEAIAREGWQKIQDGEITLIDAAKKYSDVPVPRWDAFIMSVRDLTGMEDIYKLMRTVKPGELAPVNEAQQAFAVVRRGHFMRSVVRHILIQHIQVPGRDLRVTLTPEQAEERAKKILSELDPHGANWAEMVDRYSDAKSSLPFDGAMGTFTNGDLSPELETILLETPPGQVAQKVAPSREGFHILWRVN